jgi:hypothetical protein
LHREHVGQFSFPHFSHRQATSSGFNVAVLASPSAVVRLRHRVRVVLCAGAP